VVNTAPTIRGTATTEPGVALPDLAVGDLVLGTPNPDTAPLRTLYRVVKSYGKHRVPLEPPASWLERLASMFQHRQPGVLVELVEADQTNGERYPAMFTAASAPALDRVTGLRRWTE
jgi:hypothetical protein